jgi:hypothetical protein
MMEHHSNQLVPPGSKPMMYGRRPVQFMSKQMECGNLWPEVLLLCLPARPETLEWQQDLLPLNPCHLILVRRLVVALVDGTLVLAQLLPAGNLPLIPLGHGVTIARPKVLNRETRPAAACGCGLWVVDHKAGAL